MQLNRGQQIAFDLLTGSDKNVFITGGAGTGKTFLLNMVTDEMIASGLGVLVCAPTGTAARLVRGITMHRALGLRKDRGPIRMPSMQIAEQSTEVLRAADVVIVDEVSMCRMDMFDCLCRSIGKVERQTGRKKRLIVFGDFFQLPPVIDKDQALLEAVYEGPVGGAFAFRAKSWKACGFRTVVLTEIVRQRDVVFQQMLNRIRRGDHDAITYFNSLPRSEPIDDAICLCGRNDEANLINRQRLDSLPGEMAAFYTKMTGQVDTARMAVPETLFLKAGARIMMLTNDPSGRYVNGSTGTVKRADEASVIVKIDGYKKMLQIPAYTWDVYDYTVGATGKLERILAGSYTQLPMKLAYAVSIHKSQGMTLEAVNLRPNCFAPHQLYTGLSRVSSPDRLYIDGEILDSDLKIDLEVKSFYEALEGDAEEQEATPFQVPEQIPSEASAAYIEAGYGAAQFPETCGTPPASSTCHTEEIEAVGVPCVPCGTDGQCEQGGRRKRPAHRPRKYPNGSLTIRIPVELEAQVRELVEAFLRGQG